MLLQQLGRPPWCHRRRMASRMVAVLVAPLAVLGHAFRPPAEHEALALLDQRGVHLAQSLVAGHVDDRLVESRVGRQIGHRVALRTAARSSARASASRSSRSAGGRGITFRRADDLEHLAKFVEVRQFGLVERPDERPAEGDGLHPAFVLQST